MRTEIGSITLIRGGREYQEVIDEAGGFGTVAGLDGQYGYEYGAVVIENTVGDNEPLTIYADLGYKLIQQVLEDDETYDDGPMGRVEVIDSEGFVIVRVEDGGIDIDWLPIVAHGEVQLDSLIAILKLDAEFTEAGTPEAPTNPAEPTEIKGSITAVDGTVTQFQIDATGGMQWGAEARYLHTNVDLIAGLVEVAAGGALLTEPTYSDSDSDTEEN